MRYEQAVDGKWIRPITKGYRMKCCDCALIHVLDFRVVNGRVEFRAFRDQRNTLRCRKRKLSKKAMAQ